MKESKQRITPFLTLCGTAEEAMNFYLSVFPDARKISIDYIGAEERGEEGKVLTALIEVMGQELMLMDMEKAYCPPDSWAISLLISCETESEFDHLFGKLSAGGSVMMGPEPVGDLRKVAWVTDRFTVTWQVVWE